MNRNTGDIQTKPGVSLTRIHTCQFLSADKRAAVITVNNDADEVSTDEGYTDALCIIFDTFSVNLLLQNNKHIYQSLRGDGYKLRNGPCYRVP